MKRLFQNFLLPAICLTLAAPAIKAIDLPARGQQIVVRTIDSIESRDGRAGQTYRASLEQPLIVDGRQVAPRGADATLRIQEVEEAGRIKGTANLKLVVSEVRMNGVMQSVTTEPVAMESKGKGKSTAVKTGVGAGIGAALGAIFGGGKGAAIGAASGGAAGATVSAVMKGPEIKIPSESVLTFQVQ
ncbi:hypothetical protein F183_A05520 [Bryobacterales bacterium F-183]|nr:hypothetical protein F183_A05520 [Bryobacterales bacterium F-183]